MKITRRDAIAAGLALGSLSALGCATTTPAEAPKGPPPPPPPPPKKTILVLGGTGFLGPHFVEAAIARGHTVTLFNRGKTRPHLYPELEKLRGDRDGGLDVLKGRKWDVVVDPSGYVPRIVKMSAELLAPSVGQYIFISTISVYAGEGPNIDETSPVGKIDDEASEDVRKHYGALKALSEAAAEKAMPGRVANVRPGLIVGPGDPTDRFTYWPARLHRGGEVLAPGNGSDPTQFIDVRDLAVWLCKVAEQNHVGVYNATGPDKKLSMKDMVDTVRTAIGSTATVTWVDADFLAKHEVSPWMDMPTWIPRAPTGDGMMRIAIKRAVDKGLTFRPLADTAKDTLAYWLSLPEERRPKPKAGLAADKEATVLAEWKKRA